MQTRLLAKASLLALFSLLMILPASIQAQGTSNSRILALRKLDGVGKRGLLRTPIYETNISRGRMNAQNWGRAYVEYDTAPDWIDEMTIRWYVLLKDRSNEYVMLKGSTSYVDIEKGRQHRAEIFIRPQTLKRYGEIAAIAVEFVSAGQTVGGEATSFKGSKNWFQSSAVDTRDGVLLNRNKTPWAFINSDDYQSIK